MTKIPRKRGFRTPSPQITVPATPKSQKILHSAARTMTPAQKRALNMSITPGKSTFRRALHHIHLGTGDGDGKRKRKMATTSPLVTKKQAGDTDSGDDGDTNAQLSPSLGVKRNKRTKLTATTVTNDQETDSESSVATDTDDGDGEELAPATPMAITPRKRGRPRKSMTAKLAAITAKENQPFTRSKTLKSLIATNELSLDAPAVAKAIVQAMRVMDKKDICREILELEGLTQKEKLLASMVAAVSVGQKEGEQITQEICEFLKK
ncbi:hypothetical protein TWF696_004632 [Orbilia brochopaga]|uniref:Uncharacterized protein n=1 Tax=Orbilia brochopaga TaxID=3140254 RepID=A0AAV9V6Y0_9PEZI